MLITSWLPFGIKCRKGLLKMVFGWLGQGGGSDSLGKEVQLRAVITLLPDQE
jgi:hypothetical protein